MAPKGRAKEAVAVVKKIAAGNGKKFAGGGGGALDEEVGGVGGGGVRKIENGDSVVDLLRQPLLPSTLIQMYSWFVNSAAYYCLTVAASSAEKGEEGDRYM